jgi:hypothetical protein
MKDDDIAQWLEEDEQKHLEPLKIEEKKKPINKKEKKKPTKLKLPKKEYKDTTSAAEDALRELFKK